MGDPTALFVLAFAVVVLAGTAMWVLVAKGTVRSKLTAMAALVAAAVFAFVTSNVPDYARYQAWIDGSTIFAVIAAAAFAIFLLVRTVSK
jgi:hypothetical protein